MNSQSIPLLKMSRLLVPCVAAAIVGWIVWGAVAHIDITVMWAAFQSIGIWQWIGAMVCILASFRAIGHYDGIWHNVLNTGVSPRTAKSTGMAAIALGQTIGAGAVTGALVRWQCLPQLTLVRTTQLSAAVAFSFLTAWNFYAVISATVLGLFPIWLVIFSVIIASGLAFLLRKHIAKTPIVWPTKPQVLRLIGLTGLDLFFAGTALFLLMPEGTDVSYGLLLAAFVLALGLGLISNIPAGAGVLEVAIIALLAPSDMAPVLAALCGFRLVGYLAPAAVAIVWVGVHRLRPTPVPPKTPGEWDLALQDGILRKNASGTWLMGHPCGIPVTIGHPGPTLPPPVITAACYKICAKSAVKLRKKGWQIARIAKEAIITPQDWFMSGKKHATLRRKIRQASTAGIRIEHARNPLPYKQMSGIAQKWTTTHGGERGFSMGRYDTNYVAQQRVFLIWNQGNLCGFVTFQDHDTHWHLDLMRHVDDLPGGAMHLAIHTAINEAKSAGITTLSLAAVADCHFTWRFVKQSLDATKGLAQFKNCFAPKWRPLYHASPHKIGLAMTLCAITIAIQRPLARVTAQTAARLGLNKFARYESKRR